MTRKYDWSEWSMVLIRGFDALQKDIVKMNELVHKLDLKISNETESIKIELINKINELNITVVKLQVKAAMAGGIIGIIFTAIVGLIFKLLEVKLIGK